MKRTPLKRTALMRQNKPAEPRESPSPGMRRFAGPDGQVRRLAPQNASYGRQKAARWQEQKAKECASCGNRSNLKLHHVTLEQIVVREGGDISDPRNSLTLCVVCHAGHHGMHRLALTILRDENYEFATDLLGPGAAYEALRRRYVGSDQRLDRLLMSVGHN